MLNLLRRSLFGCSPAVKSLAYTSNVRPHLEYASIVWNPHTSSDTNLLEAVQNRAACWICATWDRDTHSWSKSLNACLGELKWLLLVHRRTLIIFTAYCITRNPSYSKTILNSTRSHQLIIQPASSSINAFRYYFFVNSIFLWNHIPFDILCIVCKHLFHCKLRTYLW